MSAFVPAFMSSEIAEGLDARFNHYQWAGVPYLLNAMGDVYRMADYRTMDRAYAGYHTLSCDMAVDWLREGVRSA